MSGWPPGTSCWLAAAILIGAGATCTSAQISVPPLPASPPYAPPAEPGQASSRWPLRLDGPDGQITIYQPQLRSFDGNQLKGRAAVSVVPPGQQEPLFGAMWMESRVATDRVARTVQILDTTVTQVTVSRPGRDLGRGAHQCPAELP